MMGFCGVWSHWEAWSDCQYNQFPATKQRSRICRVMPENIPKDNCVGPFKQMAKCDDD